MASKIPSKENGSGRPVTYDVIELRDDLNGLSAGSRGTIVVEGMRQGLVDFAWTSGSRDVELHEPMLCPVPYGVMKLVASQPKLREKELAQAGGERSQSR